jgi:YVTN family beta-propeller protein
MRLNRRHFLLSTSGLAACGPQLAKPFNGAAYIASQEARTVSIVSLSRFKLAKEIPLDAAPSGVLVNQNRAYVLTPANGTITEIDATTGTVAGKHRLAGSAVMMRMGSDGKSIWLLARDPQALIQFDLMSGRTGRTIKLPKPARDFDLSPTVPYEPRPPLRAVIGNPAGIFNLETGRLERLLEIDGDVTPIRFRPDGKEVLAGHGAARLISIAEVETGRLLVKLPLPLEPEQFCFTLDGGGQMFVSGRGMDAVVIVSPYQSSIDETILAGHAPGSMAVDANNIYVANPESGDLTVIAIADRSLLAKIPVGEEPVQVMLTPDGQYCLVVNRKSSDLSVIRISKLGGYQRSKAAPMFTVVPLGASPVSGAICRI